MSGVLLSFLINWKRKLEQAGIPLHRSELKLRKDETEQ